MARKNTGCEALRFITFVVSLFMTSVSLFAQESSKSSWWNPFSAWGSTSAKTATKSQFASSSWAPPSSSQETADEAQWSWPTLPKPKWKMPSWSMPKPAWPSWSTYGKATKPKKPSAWSSWNQSTKRWWRNTADFLSPYPPESYSKPKPSTGWGKHSSSPSYSDDSSGGSFWGFWGESEQEKKISTPTEFFGQPQP